MSDLLTAKQVASMLGVHHRTLEGWRAKRTGPAWVKLGDGVRARVRYTKEAVMQYINRSTVK